MIKLSNSYLLFRLTYPELVALWSMFNWIWKFSQKTWQFYMMTILNVNEVIKNGKWSKTSPNRCILPPEIIWDYVSVQETFLMICFDNRKSNFFTATILSLRWWKPTFRSICFVNIQAYASLYHVGKRENKRERWNSRQRYFVIKPILYGDHNIVWLWPWRWKMTIHHQINLQ